MNKRCNFIHIAASNLGKRGRDRMTVGFTTTMQSVPIITKEVSLNPTHGKVYSIQHYVIKFIIDLQQVGGFLWVLRFPPPIKLTSHDIMEILLKVALNTINYQPSLLLVEATRMMGNDQFEYSY